MEINQIRFFLALADTLNFTRAAEICDVSQPALSRGVKKLEDELGGQLVRRERGRTHLTELGERVRPRFAQAISLAELAMLEANDMSRMADAKLRLGVMCTIGPSRLIALIEHLTAKKPDMKLELFDGSSSNIVERLLDGEFDVALSAAPVFPDAAQAHPLYQERYVVAFPAGHRFEQMSVVPMPELAGERYLERINCDYSEHAAALGDDSDAAVQVLYQSEHEDWIQAMIVAGLGCSCMPEFTPLYPELQTRRLVEPDVSRTISVITKRGRKHAPNVELFVRLCRTMNWGPVSKAI